MKLRDFDFRVWDEGIKGYVKNQAIAIIDNRVLAGSMHIGQIGEFEFMSENYDDEIEIELFTGLYDKNGKKAYENDIVKAKNPFNYLEAKISIHKEGTFYLENKSGHYIGSLIYLVEDEGYTIEIIGNIHENPELLKC
ncbi:YopX family protein [Campylobacter sp. US33a]|uniref:YopX family protein n=1 Tax=Campylobacter sp. US33a TaxID=2498120 RepID=UPI001067689D|nr:YopX family protein [Campylobacter sp. US33a]TEY01262.1 hypothetical protein ELQ16_07840 [Campylobacter sp. US33a]